MPVYARTRIPPAVPALVFNLNRKDILFTIPHHVCYVIPESGITIRVIAQMPAIKPHICIHVNAVKLQNEMFVLKPGRNKKCFPVPAGSSYCVSGRYTSNSTGINR